MNHMFPNFYFVHPSSGGKEFILEKIIINAQAAYTSLGEDIQHKYSDNLIFF